MATNPDDEITAAEIIAVIVVGILIFALLVLQIALLIYIFCRKKRCCCFKDTEKKAIDDSRVETSITCCPTRGGKSRGSVASDEYNLIREASLHSETLVIPVVDEFVETRPLDPVYLKEKKRKEKEKKKEEKKKKAEEEKKEKNKKEEKKEEKKKEKRKGEGEDQDDVKGRGDPAIAALKLEAILTPAIEKERQPRLNYGPSDTNPCGKEIDHPQTGGDPGTSGGDPGTTGGDPGTTGGDPGISGGDPGINGGDPGISGGDPGISGPTGKDTGEPSTREGLLTTEFTLPGQLEDDAIVREDPFIKGRGRSFRRPIGQYTHDMPKDLPCFSLPPKGVVRAWEDKQDKDKRGDPGEKKASPEHSLDEDLGYSEGSRKESTDEGSGGGIRELDSGVDKNRERWSPNVDKTQHLPDTSFPGDPGTRVVDAKKSKRKTKGGQKVDERRGSQDVAKTEGGKGWNGRDPRGHHVEGGPGSEDKLIPGEGDGSGDGDGNRKKRDQNGHRLYGRPDSGEATTTQALGKAGPSRVIVGNDGDSGIMDLGRGDGETRTDPVARNRNNQGGYYVVDDDDDDQHSMSDDGYKYWPDRVGRFRGMDHYDSADSEMVPDELGVEDAEFDDENRLMRTYTGSELNTTNPPRDNSDVKKMDRQRAVNLGRGLPSGAIVDTDEELSRDSKEASGNGLPQNNAKAPKSGSSRQKKHPDDQKHEDRGQHGKKRPKENHDTATPGVVGTESSIRQPTLQLGSHRRKNDPTIGSGSRTRHQPTLQLRSQRRVGNQTEPLPHSDDPDDPRQGTSGQGHQAPLPAGESTVEKREKMRRKRRRNRDTEMSVRTLAAEGHHSWNAYMEHDNFCELPSPLTIIFFDSDDDLR